MAARHPLGELDLNTQSSLRTPSILKVKKAPKRGPKSKPICGRIYKPKRRVNRSQVNRSRECKIDCLMMRQHYKVPVRNAYSGIVTRYRQPTWKEIGRHFGGQKHPIPEATLQGWESNQE